ncbi:MAG: hypothetical protein RRY64_01185 [Oscillospiraceae bacterium]
MGDLNLKLARVADTKAAMATLFRGRGLNPDAVTFRGYAGLIGLLLESMDTELAALEATLAAQNTLVSAHRKDLGIRGGVNAAGVAWSTEETTICDKPYLLRPGYLQSVAECSAGNSQPRELYEWIYRRLFVGDSVTSFLMQEQGGLYEHQTVKAYAGVDYLIIPVGQFSGIMATNYYDATRMGADTLMKYYLRVYWDNPQLCNAIPTWLLWKYGDGRVAYLGVPLYTQVEIKNMQEVCRDGKAKVEIEVYKRYALRPGDTLTKVQKIKVGKLIHDWLVLHNQYDQVNEAEMLDQMLYPAMSDGINAPVCASYAMAYQWLCNLYGIEAMVITGVVYNGISVDHVPQGGPHAWNMVNHSETPGSFGDVSADWSETDCTWDDPTGTTPEYIRWRYLYYPTARVGTVVGRLNNRGRYTEAYTYPVADCTGDHPYTGGKPYEWEGTV